ncbi:MAG: protein arginine kinase [Candidatus Eisenbacteria bacterium]
MDLEDLARTPGPWLDGSGPRPDLVVSTRVRLARNLRGMPFSHRARDEQLIAVLGSVERAARATTSFAGGGLLRMHELSPIDRQFLVERHLVSHELSDGARPRALVLAEGERLSIMVNEEDHLRLQALCSGFQLAEAWALAERADEELEQSLEYAFEEELGYLTACPTNVGTGMRASVLIHLPALVLTKQIDKVLKSVMQVGLAVRGLYGEGSEVMGNLFQMSNQTTLGRSEQESVESLDNVTRQILDYEERARDVMVRDAGTQIADKVWRAYGNLRHGRSMSSQEVINLCSALRLGTALGFNGLPPLSTINQLLVLTQPAHLMRSAGRALEAPERNVLRADLVRALLDRANSETGSSGQG